MKWLNVSMVMAFAAGCASGEEAEATLSARVASGEGSTVREPISMYVGANIVGTTVMAEQEAFVIACFEAEERLRSTASARAGLVITQIHLGCPSVDKAQYDAWGAHTIYTRLVIVQGAIVYCAPAGVTVEKL